VTHYSYRNNERPALELDTDYVVVGSGPGGATIAHTLAEGGAKVVVVEAGPWLDPEDYPHSMAGTMRDLMDEWGALIVKGRAMWPVVQSRVVGGGSVINSAIVVRTPGDIFTLWQDQYGFGADGLADEVWRHQDRIESDLFVQTVPKASFGRSNLLAQRGAEALGLHDHDMLRSVKDCLGRGECLQGCKAGRKQSMNLNYIPDVLRLGGDILSCAPVRKVMLEGDRAVGVSGVFVHPRTKGKGAPFQVRARKAVIVAASATHSPALLLRSGIKSKTLGHFFRAHPGTGIFGSYEEPVHMNRGATQGWSTTKLRESHGFKLETLSIPLELVASRLGGAGTQLIDRVAEFPHLAMWVMAVRSEAIGRVKAGFGGQPSVSYTHTRGDMEKLRTAAHYIARMHIEAGARSVVPAIYGLPYRLGPDEIDLIKDGPLDPRCYTAILSHLFGGCIMGTDPQRSVCDPDGNVHGYKGLVISDASAIPTTLGVNPQHTIMALSCVKGERLLEM
jgi:choline dehydrogenase-like flavoprotein